MEANDSCSVVIYWHVDILLISCDYHTRKFEQKAKPLASASTGNFVRSAFGSQKLVVITLAVVAA